MEFSGPLILGFVAGFFLLAIVTLTSFAKISIVMMVVRQALGLQQVPSNIILLALALFISIFISMPVFSASLGAVIESDASIETVQGMFDLWNAGVAPFQRFLVANIDAEYLGFFVDISNEVWSGSGITGSENDFVIQVPAFMISELTEAFRIGFLLYLPFIAIDLAVTGILMALGMQMVQPNIIAVPFKLLTFVFVDGWARLVEGLVLTYTA
ncbi:EscR/YscR/HrcR family type III secretion system export apparatus protein [Aestuariibius insulae]|uniref:EscR/YscR/HrcR family type III secretion system export apparatus protein n=1 Tax=Aestuariibius insulae TaxID=2058287 RepID=UPI00345ECC5F